MVEVRSNETENETDNDSSIGEDEIVEDEIRGGGEIHKRKREIEKERSMNMEVKKIKVMKVYQGPEFEDKVDHVRDRLVKHVRTKVWSLTKFVKGEGQRNVVSIEKRKRLKLQKNCYDKSNKTVDILNKQGYAYKVLEAMEMNEGKYLLKERALWWKTYGEEVRNEIRKMRNRCGFQIRTVVQSSK